MTYNIDGINYDVIIVKKNNKNIYVRVKDDLSIYVTCNYLTPKYMIKKILDSNQEFLSKSMKTLQRKKKNDDKVYYLGNSYDIIYEDISEVKIIGDKIIVKDQKMFNKWYNDEILNVFDDRYIYIFNKFKENIKSPLLKVRTMKSRWGVYNRKNHSITLNSKLIEFDVEKIDYVIVHELSHIIHFNHSKEFWNLVSKYVPNYKEIRKEMRVYEIYK